jgi:hypothetical protein
LADVSRLIERKSNFFNPRREMGSFIRLPAEVGKREKRRRGKGERNVPFALSPFPLSGARFLIFARGLLL